RARLARHLWRMCWAMWIATGSFFLGQADELPERLRVWPALIFLAVVPLLAMLYWLVRIRIRRPLRGVTGASLRAAALAARQEILTPQPHRADAPRVMAQTGPSV
ncbi:MAG TPA: hypothetical protein VFQ45_10445, partial [Longimicrobium sp.]|nr:hypothetical protein [Longimicrobium sp.]